jgi:AmmeMemoRadiSam system protein B
MSVRPPAVAGSFYPAGEAELKEAITGAYLHRLGPGRLPPLEGGKEPHGVLACVSPHAGYEYSGPIAAHSLFHLSEMRDPELVVIVGPNHYRVGSGIAAYGEGEWETPLGRVAVDATATRRIVELAGIVDLDKEAHRLEHSIEVQLPFLQQLYGGSFKLLPISLGFQEKATARDLGRWLAELLKEETERGRDAILIASSDLTHYESSAEAKEKDTALLQHVKALDIDGFYATWEKKRMTACGYGAIGTVMEACRHLGFERGEVDAYATSGDMTGENDAVVGYPSVSFVRRRQKA